MNTTLLKRFGWLRFSVCLGALALFCGWTQWAGAATLTTDRLDYPPFSDVYIDGTGFGHNDSITVTISQVNADGSHTFVEQLAATADDSGSFTAVWYIFSDQFNGATVEAVATGTPSGVTAAVTFTDAIGVNLDQLQNGGASDATPGWSNGSINQNNSTYKETRSVPFRYFVSGLGNNSTHFFTLQAEWTKGGIHAYDYFTSYNRTESAGITAAGGTCGTLDTAPEADCQAPSIVGVFPDPKDPANWDFTSVGGSAPADFFSASFLLDSPRDLYAYHVSVVAGSVVTFGKYYFSGSASDREINIKITFTTTGIPSGGSVGFLWGGHLASGLPATWGLNNGASSISGAPFHMRTQQLDDSGNKNQDRSVSPTAVVCVDPNCTITGPASVFAGSTGNTYSGVAGYAAYVWAVSGNAGVTIDGSTIGQSVKINVAGGATGTFTVSLTVFDEFGCDKTCTKPVEIQPTPAGCISPLTSVCEGALNVSYTVDPANQGAGASYAWTLTANNTPAAAFASPPNSAQPSVSVNAGGPGSYTVHVVITYANGSSLTCDQLTLVNAAPTASAVATPARCFGENGSVNLTISGGTPPYTQVWNNGATTEDLASVPAGTTYSVVVTDANGCTATASATVTQPAALTCTASQVSPVSCFGQANGSATVTPSGGNGGNTFLWDNNQTTATATGLSAGLHSVTVTDAKGCTTSCSVTITGPDALTCTASQVSPVKCFGQANGSATVTPSGGNGGNTFLWDNNETTATATGLNAGLHSVTVTDAKGCTTSCSVTITGPDALTCTASQVSPVSCFGQANGSATVTPSGGNGGNTFLWDNNQTTGTATGLSAGLHSVTVTDAKGCTTSCSVTITGPDALTCTASQVSPVSCFGQANGSATVTPSGGNGGNTFLWDNNQTTATATGLSAGLHSVTVTDAKGCTTSCSVTITGPDALTCTASQVSPVSCFGQANGSATVTPSGGNGGNTFLWDNNQTTATATGLSAGLHSVTVTDAKGCTTSCSVTITGPDALTCTASQVSPVSCFGQANGSATVTPSGGNGGNTFLWDNNQTTATATGLSAGLHSVTVTDAKGCTTSCSVTITGPDALTCTASQVSPVKCFGQANGSATVTPSGGNGGNTFLWDNNETTATATGLNAGLHSVTVTDAKGCTTSCSVTITGPDALTCTASQVSPVKCFGQANGSATVTPSGGNGGNTFLWDNNETTATATGLSAGLHSVTVTDAKGCTTSCSVTITGPDALTCTASQVSPVKCFGQANGSATVTPSGGNGGNTFLWDNNETTATATGLSAGLHSVTVTDAKGCTTMCTVTITQPYRLTCTASQVSPVKCFGQANGSATVTPSGGNGGNTFLWDNNETTATATGLNAGLHSVTVTDAKGCTTMCTVTITGPAALTCTASQVSPVKCFGQANGSATVTPSGGNGGNTFLWDNNETTATATGLNAGLHSVTVTDAKGCTTMCTVTITGPAALTCSLAKTDVKCYGAANGTITASASGGSAPIQCKLDSGSFGALGTFTGVAAGPHTVYFKDANGCTDAKSVQIDQPATLACTVSGDSMVLPGSGHTLTANVTGGTQPYSYSWTVSDAAWTIADPTANPVSYTAPSSPSAATFTVTVTDANGCKTTCTEKVTGLPPSLVTDSSLCTYDLVPGGCKNFRLLFTQDPQNWPCYKLTASNPGQTFFNVFGTGTPGQTLTFTMTIPYPYVTQGANPIHAYDWVTAVMNSSGACLTPGNGIPVTLISDPAICAPATCGTLPVTLTSYGGNPTYSLTVQVVVPASGFVYVNLHLDYGLKGTGGYTTDGSGNAIPGSCATPATVTILNNGTYVFSVSGDANDSDQICNINAFKRNPGVGGLTQKVKTVDGAVEKIEVGGCTAVLKDAKGAVLTTGTSDEDGWYLLSYKYTGKAATFYVTVTPPGKPAQTQTITLKANGYVQADFVVPNP